MKVLVTGVAGQLGHDVMNELAKRGYEGIGSDIKEVYSGIQDGTAVTTMPYVPMDITDKASVETVLKSTAPDVVVHCAAWTAVDLAEDEDKKPIVQALSLIHIQMCIRDRDYIYLTEKVKNAFTEIDRTQKNTELVKASRPVMTEKFFHDLLHYPGENPAAHLSQYLEYLDLKFDYDYFHVLIIEAEYNSAKPELDFTQYQNQLLNVLDLIKEQMQIFDHVFYLKEFSGCLLYTSRCV